MDANNTSEHLTTKLVSVLVNHKNSGTLINPISKTLVFTYHTKSYITSLNSNWENPNDFMAAFSTLFLFEVGGYLF